jgi:antitoxin component YwqK of YwqJK toxin-antitoxin module
MIKVKANYVKGRRCGLYKEWNDDGDVILECNYEKGVLDGICQTYYPHKKTESRYCTQN